MKNGEALLRDAILLYLRRNPNAADTMEGIVKWWLPSLLGEVNARSAEKALEQMVAAGLIQKTILVDGTEVYSRRVQDSK